MKLAFTLTLNKPLMLMVTDLGYQRLNTAVKSKTNFEMTLEPFSTSLAVSASPWTFSRKSAYSIHLNILGWVMKRKSGIVAFILWCLGLVGLCGLHRFYVGRPGSGILWLLTLGLLGFGQIFDLFFLGSMVRQANLQAVPVPQGGLQNTNTNTNTVAPVFNITIAPPVMPAPGSSENGAA